MPAMHAKRTPVLMPWMFPDDPLSASSLISIFLSRLDLGGDLGVGCGGVRDE